jgi:HD-like signal output (HDOD) protein
MTQAVSEVLRRLSTLPPFPKVTAKLLAMLEDETVSVEDLAGIISTDPSLAVKVIHLSNSPFYMSARQVQSVRDAVFVLGINSIKNITAGLSIQKGLAAVQPRSSTFAMFEFWKHSYATAIAANRLGARHDRRLGDTLYLAGLIHDVGKMVQAYYWPDLWKGLYKTQEQTGEMFHVIEDRLGAHPHAEIAGQLLRNWKFPTAISDLVQGHHIPFEDGLPDDLGRRTLQEADRLVIAMGHGFPHPDRRVYGLDIDAYSDLIQVVETELEHQLKVLDS